MPDSSNPYGDVMECSVNCTCPSPYVLTSVDTPLGPVTECALEGSDNGGGDCPDGQSKVYDPSTGQMVCPTSEGGSSSSTSSFCLVPGDYNGDCVPDSEQGSSSQNSSAPASTPASAPASTPNTSSPTASAPSTGGGGGSSPSTGGGGDGGGSPSTGGGGGGGSGSGSGSGSPNSSSSSAGGAGNSSSSVGQCDPYSKTYFSCVTSLKVTADGDIPWQPFASYGNWLPVSEDSPCPNKFKDAQGNWFCSGGGVGSGTAASSASAASAA
uniref:hypothetical protein n=1 Tax=Cellvibrio sp. OA-2007 TaxID=529823 RepID=UPI00193108D9